MRKRQAIEFKTKDRASVHELELSLLSSLTSCNKQFLY